MPNVAWSYTALTSFETCPRKHYLTRVSKEVTEPMGEAAIWGDTVHKHLAARAEHGTPLPSPLTHLEPLVARITSTPGELVVERKMTIDSAFQPVSWRSKDAWCRGVLDVGIIGKTSAAVFDYKTGKYKPDNDQLKLFANMTFASYANVDTVKTAFLWLKGDGPPTVQSFHREDAAGIWQEFIARVARLEQAYSENRWGPRPNGLCKKYCPVGRARCDYCGTD